jgi:hypothetical protein
VIDVEVGSGSYLYGVAFQVCPHNRLSRAESKRFVTPREKNVTSSTHPRTAAVPTRRGLLFIRPPCCVMIRSDFTP